MYVAPWARVLRAAYRVVVRDGDQAAFIQERYGVAAKRVTVIPNGVSAEYLTLVRRADLRADHAPFEWDQLAEATEGLYKAVTG